jgi:hypothetical protein
MISSRSRPSPTGLASTGACECDLGRAGLGSGPVRSAWVMAAIGGLLGAVVVVIAHYQSRRVPKTFYVGVVRPDGSGPANAALATPPRASVVVANVAGSGRGWSCRRRRNLGRAVSVGRPRCLDGPQCTHAATAERTSLAGLTGRLPYSRCVVSGISVRSARRCADERSREPAAEPRGC